MSFYPFKGAVRAIREAAGLVGMEKLMWGSDYPRTITAITYRMSYDFVVKSNELSDEENPLFLGGNAKLSTASVPCPYYLILKTCQNESISDYIAASYGFKGNRSACLPDGRSIVTYPLCRFLRLRPQHLFGAEPDGTDALSSPGHEVGATIEVVGTDVPDFLRPGQNVTVNPYTNCGKCAACRNGRVNACEHNETFGVQRDGTMTEFVAVPAESRNGRRAFRPRLCFSGTHEAWASMPCRVLKLRT